MQNIIKYVPKMQYITKNRVIALSVLANVLLAVVAYWSIAQVYNFKCAEGGYFVTDAKCGEMADSNFYRAEYYRLSANEDMGNAAAIVDIYNNN